MSLATDRSRGRAILSAVFVTMLWSSSWVLIRFGLDSEALRPITFAGLRYSLASVVLWAVVVARSETRGEVVAHAGGARWPRWALSTTP